MTEADRAVMFERNAHPGPWKSCHVLNQFRDALRGMHNDGSCPVMRRMRWSVRSLVAKRVREVNQLPDHEYIVSETRRCYFSSRRRQARCPAATSARATGCELRLESAGLITPARNPSAFERQDRQVSGKACNPPPPPRNESRTRSGLANSGCTRPFASRMVEVLFVLAGDVYGSVVTPRYSRLRASFRGVRTRRDQSHFYSVPRLLLGPVVPEHKIEFKAKRDHRRGIPRDERIRWVDLSGRLQGVQQHAVWNGL